MPKTKEQAREAVASLKARLEEFQGQLSDEECALILARFAGYSPRNAMLVAMQRPDATEVRGFRAWLQFGRCVRKGERGIQILAPAGQSREQTEQEKQMEAEGWQTSNGPKQYFKLAYVFDVQQTDPLPGGEDG